MGAFLIHRNGVVVINAREQQLIEDLAEQAQRMMVDWPSSRDRQKKFVLKYIENGFGNATEAARQAGYSGKTAKEQAGRMLSNVNFAHIQDVISEFKAVYNEKLAELSILTPTELMQFWSRIILNEEKDSQMIGVGEGAQEVIEVPASMKDKLKSSELLGKTHIMFTDKVEQTNRNIEVVVGDWDEEDED